MKNNKVISFVLVLMLVLSSVVFVHADTQAIVHTQGAISEYIDGIEMHTTTGGPINSYGFDPNPPKSTWKTTEDYNETTETIISLDIMYSFGFTHVITKQELIDAGIIGTEGQGSINFHLYDEIPFPYEEFSIEVEKVADMYEAHVDDIITYTVTVTNTNEYDLPDVEVIDSMFGTLISDEYLVAGDSLIFEMTASAIEGTMTNIVTASSLTGEVYDSDMVEVVVTEPMYDIEVTKEADPTMAYVGDEITYTVVVTNPTDLDLMDIVVEDSMYGVVDPDLDLGPGEHETYTMTTSAVLGTMMNVVTASAMDHEVWDSASAMVEVEEAPYYEIDIEKDVNMNEAYVGEELMYTVVVTNMSNQPLMDIMVEDSMFGTLHSDLDLGVGEHHEFMMTKAAVLGTMMNTATASAMGGDGYIMDSDSGEVVVTVRPAYGIRIEKVADMDNAYVGDVITYTITVENTGNQMLDDIDVDDSMFGMLDMGISLGAMESKEYVMTKAAMLGTMYNIATASAMDGEYMDSDDATVEVMEVPDYGIDIMKEANTTSAYIGDTIIYTVTVYNTGNQMLDDIHVEDSMFGVLETGLSLGALEHKHYEMTKAAMNIGPMYNIATASAMEGSLMDYDDATVDVMEAPGYGLEITKTVDDSSVYINDTVTYTVVIMNTGDYTLYSLTLFDNDGYDISTERAIDMISPGAFEEFTFSTSYSSTGQKTNVAEIQYWVDDEVEMWSSDTAIVDVSRRSTSRTDYEMTIEKDASAGEVFVGDVVTYTITVTNTGEGTLRDIDVEDDMVGLDETIATLLVGDSEVFEVEYTASEEGVLENTATATDDRAGVEEDTAIVIVNGSTPLGSPQMSIDKEFVPGMNQMYMPGYEFEFTITVMNTGSETLTNILVQDSMANFETTIPMLGPGESQMFTVMVTIPEGYAGEMFENVAMATNNQTGTIQDSVILFFDEEVPLGIPDTGVMPFSPFVGLSAVIFAAGVALFNKKED